MSDENVDLVLRGYRAFLAGDLDTVRALLDPEIEWHGLAAEAAPAQREEVEFINHRVRAGRARSARLGLTFRRQRASGLGEGAQRPRAAVAATMQVTPAGCGGFAQRSG